MATITFQSNKLNVFGALPAVGSKAPNFTLSVSDLSDVSLADFAGKKLVLNIFPSIDTPVCAHSVRRFNKEATALENTVVLCVSADLPFAGKRFCGAEGIDNVTTASFFRSPSFTEDYGVKLNEGALKGLAARAVIVLDETGSVTYSELVSELSDEPNYEAVLSVL